MSTDPFLGSENLGNLSLCFPGVREMSNICLSLEEKIGFKDLVFLRSLGSINGKLEFPL